ncbi:MAG: family transcriptional regulator [Anaerocolumna sp.]|jgi:transcriptional regulator with XRE-family HTH domain|nr:family transcriptional regulator [Anaerocolumna sp.]
MNTKPVALDELLEEFTKYISEEDIIIANLLAKISGVIVKKRLDMNMTQREFADYMQVSQGMVSKWESKDYNFTIETLVHVCTKLDIQVDVVIKSDLIKYKKLINKNIQFCFHTNWKINEDNNLISLDKAV